MSSRLIEGYLSEHTEVELSVGRVQNDLIVG